MDGGRLGHVPSVNFSTKVFLQAKQGFLNVFAHG